MTAEQIIASAIAKELPKHVLWPGGRCSCRRWEFNKTKRFSLRDRISEIHREWELHVGMCIARILLNHTIEELPSPQS